MILNVKNLYKNFGQVEVLKGISFSMEKGEVIAIIGSSGSGKSTLLRCLTFLERMDRGSMELDGEILISAGSVYPPESILKEKALKLGLVFQDFNLFPHLSVMENLLLAPDLAISRKIVSLKGKMKEQLKVCSSSEKKIIKQKFADEAAALKETGHQENIRTAEALLQRVGLSERKDMYPFQLSGGQKQRAAIARALALSPEILCFDEPTSALDPELTGEVLRVIKDLKTTHSTMIVVTHEMNFAKHVADRVIFMAGGVVEEIGTPEEVFSHPKSPKTAAFLEKSLEKF